MWYKGDVFFSIPCVHSHLLGMNWRHKALLLICKQCREYLRDPDQHTFFMLRVHTLKMKALCPRLGPGKYCRGLTVNRQDTSPRLPLTSDPGSSTQDFLPGGCHSSKAPFPPSCQVFPCFQLGRRSRQPSWHSV